MNSKHFWRFGLTLAAIFCLSNLYAQNFTISGKVTDKENGEELIGATIQIAETGAGMVTNEYGFYSLTLPKGTYTVQYTYIGFKTETRSVVLDENKVINVELGEEGSVLNEATVKATKTESKVENKKISVVKMDIKSIKEIPVLFGEVDVLKTITLMPGIQSAGEGNSGINVRGGGQDQNLILLDEATVYNASHLLGFFSVFNGDAIKDLEVYKGGIPSKYGGRLSSLIDIRMKDGNNKRFGAQGGIGTISSRLTLEGPIVKNKSSFMVSGRRSYADLFIPLANNDALDGSQLYFYDLNLKANYILSDKDRLYVSAYFGRDVFSFGELFTLNWGNATTTLRWNHIYNPKLFSNISLVYSDFNYGFGIKFAENANFGLEQNIRDIYIKPDFTYYLSTKSTLGFGGQLTYHRFNPGLFQALNEASQEFFTDVQLQERNALESGIYVDHRYEFNEKLKIRYGLRLSTFSNIGGTEYTYFKNENFEPIPDRTISTTFEDNEIYNTYYGLEPRFSFSYKMREMLALKGSYNRTFQYIQQASNTASAFPTDQWFSANLNVKPQIADQVAIGIFKNFEGWETSSEVYYKWLQNQIDYRDQASIAFNEFLDGELLFGRGWAYGSEWYISRTEGDLTGFLSYTWSRTMREIVGINGDNPYPANFDRRHNLSLVLTYKFSPRVTATGSFVYFSGNPFTTPNGKYWYNGQWNPRYGERNNFRIPDYHRADIGVTLKGRTRPDKRFKSNWNFSVYNLYARENAFSIYFNTASAQDVENYPELNLEEGQTVATRLALFKIIPAVTWNFEF